MRGSHTPTGTDGAVPPASARQTALALDDIDTPVPYRLTPQARRVVAPEKVPSLTIVPEDLADPHDPRSSRARALRRSGSSVEEIARSLAVDPMVVRTWVSDVGVAMPRRLQAVRSHAPVRPAAPSESDDERDRRRQALAAERAAAANEIGRRLEDASFVRGLSLATATAELSEHGLLVTVRDADVAAVALSWLRKEAGVDRRDVRIVLRLGALAGSDLVLHRWSQALDLDPAALTRSLWRGAPSQDAVEAMIRISDPHVAARVAGWRDVLLAGDLGSRVHPDVGF